MQIAYFLCDDSFPACFPFEYGNKTVKLFYLLRPTKFIFQTMQKFNCSKHNLRSLCEFQLQQKSENLIKLISKLVIINKWLHVR